MSAQITTTGTGDNATFNVYYSVENRQKRLEWVSGSCTVRKLYSALQNLFDELGQMDDGVPMSAQTPTAFTIGIIDAGDKDPWFIDRTSVEYLTGGALETASWARVQDSNTGIIRITCATNTSIVAGDIGYDITTGAGDSGTLLDIKGSGAGTILWIRPDSNAAANNFDSSDTLTCNTHIATFTYGAVTNPATGESLWANIYTLGTIENNTHIYIYQSGSNLVAYKGTTDWWTDKTTGASTDHIDILVNVKEVGLEVDEYFLTVLARQYSKTYSYYIVDLSSGGRNPIPLQTGDDLDNTTGYRTFTASGVTGTFNAGNYIYVGASWTAATKRGVLTAVSGNDLTYYLIGDPITDFAASDSIVEWTGTANDAIGTAGAPSDAGPAALSPLPTHSHRIHASS